MKTKHFGGTILACAIILSLFCLNMSATNSVMRAETFESNQKNIVGMDNVFKAWSTLHVSNDDFRAGTYVEQVDSELLAPGAIRYQARLYNESGRLQVSSVVVSNTTGALPATFTTFWDGNTAFSRGWVSVKTSSSGSRTEYVLPQTETVSRTVTAEKCISLSEIAKTALDEDGRYPVNECGESFGSMLLADIVGEVPNLMEAVGTNGELGYVRTVELQTYRDTSDNQDVFIPLYDANGSVIGSFRLYSVS